MHIHSAQASAVGNALAGAQDAETSMSLRRARELRDAAARLKAASFEIGASIPQGSESDPETAAQTVSHDQRLGRRRLTLQPIWLIHSRALCYRCPFAKRTEPDSGSSNELRSSGPVSYWA